MNITLSNTTTDLLSKRMCQCTWAVWLNFSYRRSYSLLFSLYWSCNTLSCSPTTSMLISITSCCYIGKNIKGIWHQMYFQAIMIRKSEAHVCISRGAAFQLYVIYVYNWNVFVSGGGLVVCSHRKKIVTLWDSCVWSLISISIINEESCPLASKGRQECACVPSLSFFCWSWILS